MTRYDLSPLFRTSVGFDRVSHLMDAALESERNAVRYPPYNIAKTGDDDYRITLAVAGFSREELELSVEDRALTVRSVPTAAEEEGVTYLHRGIAARQFERRFTLAEHIRVTGADLDNGLLHIQLHREIPEQLKPRRIHIGTTADALAAK